MRLPKNLIPGYQNRAMAPSTRTSSRPIEALPAGGLLLLGHHGRTTG